MGGLHHVQRGHPSDVPQRTCGAGAGHPGHCGQLAHIASKHYGQAIHGIRGHPAGALPDPGHPLVAAAGATAAPVGSTWPSLCGEGQGQGQDWSTWPNPSCATPGALGSTRWATHRGRRLPLLLRAVQAARVQVPGGGLAHGHLGQPGQLRVITF